MRISSRTIFTTVVVVLIMIIVVVWWNNKFCISPTTPPTIPLYPNRRLIKETQATAIVSYIEQAFISSDKPLQILEYYQTKATCYEIPRGWACIGGAVPTGEFTIYISNSVSAETRFSTYINWDYCY